MTTTRATTFHGRNNATIQARDGGCVTQSCLAFSLTDGLGWMCMYRILRLTLLVLPGAAHSKGMLTAESSDSVRLLFRESTCFQFYSVNTFNKGRIFQMSQLVTRVITQFAVSFERLYLPLPAIKHKYPSAFHCTGSLGGYRPKGR